MYPGGKAEKNPHAHTRTYMRIEMDKISARASREKRSEGEKKRGCLAPGSAGSSKKGANPTEYPEPQLKLEKLHDDSGPCILFRGRGLVVIGRWPLVSPCGSR